MLLTTSEWQKVHERREGFTTCFWIALSMMTLAATDG